MGTAKGYRYGGCDHGSLIGFHFGGESQFDLEPPTASQLEFGLMTRMNLGGRVGSERCCVGNVDALFLGLIGEVLTDRSFCG